MPAIDIVQRPRRAACLLLIALAHASCSGESSEEADVCGFVQNSIRVRAPVMSMPNDQEAIEGLIEEEKPKVTIDDDDSPQSANKTVNKTVIGNQTVEVDVTENITDKANDKPNKKVQDKVEVTSDTKEVKIEQKVVNDDVVETKTKTKKMKPKNLPGAITWTFGVGKDNATSAGDNDDKDEDDDDEKERQRHPEKIEEPFAKENITVKEHVLNITRRMNSTHSETQNVTIKEIVKKVMVATPWHITSIYIILFVPVIVAWALYFHHGRQIRHYVWLLPFTMMAMSVGQDMVNQSLTLILRAPNAITAIQAFAMSILTGAWCLCYKWEELRCDAFIPKAMRWMGVAIFFSIYQLMNHLVYALCSLSERTVITNLAPIIVLAMENAMFSSDLLKPKVSFNAKIALALMVVGAVLFSIQSPSFTLNGLSIAMVLLLSTVPYRLAQRQFLAEKPDFPLVVLACIDGVMLGVPSLSISFGRNGHLWTDFPAFEETSICYMLVLSAITFIGLHLTTLAMLRVSYATTYLVFSNIGSIATIALGIFFFGDRALGTGLACIGLLTNVTSGMWYSSEVQSTEDTSPEKIEKEFSAARDASQ